MTEKKMNPDRELTQEEQQQLAGEEQFFKQQFSSLPSPKLPGSLSAQAMWEKICAGEGDHQITVDPAQMEPQAPQKPEGKVIDFPGSKTEEKPKRNLTLHRRRWAIACTLVLVVGLSAAYWKWHGPMEQMKDMLTVESTAEQPVEEVAEEASEQTSEDTAPVEQQNSQPSLKMAAPPQQEPQVAPASQPPEQEPQAEAVLAEEQPEETQEAQQPMQAQPSSAREQLQQQILNSISMAADAGAESEMPTESEEPVAESAGEEAQPFSIKSVMENAMDTQPQTLSLKNGSLTYQAATGEAVLSDKSGNRAAVLQLEEDAIVLASESCFAVLCPQQAQTVTMTVYDAQDLSNPKQVQQVTHQGELFDSYPSGAGSFTMVTSIWYTREQVEAGEFLPQVNGVEVQPEQVNVISGYENGEQVNYLLTTTVSKDAQKTRAELYLD
ncbi:MAG: hypothetical protein UEP78_01600 [Negativibacillus sp.]|nr:hypothetical protein [Negativibacillus sp.]